MHLRVKLVTEIKKKIIVSNRANSAFYGWNHIKVQQLCLFNVLLFLYQILAISSHQSIHIFKNLAYY